jgi:hypothetical protein
MGAPKKEKILNSTPNAAVLMLDLNDITVKVDSNLLRQFLYDMKSIDNNGIEGMATILEEFDEFLHDYYPDDSPSKHLKEFLNIIKFNKFFFLELEVTQKTI